MKKILLVFSLILFGAMSVSALAPIRMSFITSPSTTGDVTIQIYNSTATAVQFTMTEVELSSDASGVLSFVLDDGAWTNLELNPTTANYIVRITFRGLLAGNSRLEDLIRTQGLFGAEINPSEMQSDGIYNFGSITAVNGTFSGIVSDGSTNQWGILASGKASFQDLHLKATTPSTDNLTGTLIVDGGTAIAENLHVGGHVGVYGDLRVDQTSNLRGAVTLGTGVATNNGTILADGLNTGTQTGYVLINDEMRIAGNTDIRGAADFNMFNGADVNVFSIDGATGSFYTKGIMQFEGATDDDFETQLQVADPTSDKFITFPDATGTVLLDNTLNGFAWRLLGNSGTTAGTNFIGTTDNQDLVFKRGGIVSGRINTAGLNTSFGYQAMLNNSLTSGQNTAFGYNALTANTTGGYNTAMGALALEANQTGANNVAMGHQALRNNTASYNVGIGTMALGTNVTGTYNVALGHNAGNTAMTNSQHSVFIGANAVGAATGADNEIVIGYNAVGNGTNTVTLGNSSITATYLRGAVTATSYNGFTLPADDASAAGNILVSNGADKALNWSTIAAAMADLSAGTGMTYGAAVTYDGSLDRTLGIDLNANINWAGLHTFAKDVAMNAAADFNMFNVTPANVFSIDGATGSFYTKGIMQFEGATDDDFETQLQVADPTSDKFITFPNASGTVILDNTVTTVAWGLSGNTVALDGSNYLGTNNNQPLKFKVNGQNAGEINSGSNTSLGYQTLSVNTATFNTAIGYQSLNVNTSGGGNTGVGARTLSTNTIGDGNTAFGAFVLNWNTEGYQNTGVGNAALQSNQTGALNTASGYHALTQNTTGNENTAVGGHAFNNLTSGNNNVALGSGAGSSTGTVPLTNSSSSIFIGKSSYALAATGGINEIVIGCFATGHGTNSITLGNSSSASLYSMGATASTALAPNMYVDGTTGQIMMSSNPALISSAIGSTVQAYNANTTILGSDISLTSEVTGVLPIANGGTNSNTALVNNQIMVSSGNKIVEAGAMANGQILIGTTSGAPAIAAITGTSNQISVTNGAGSITLSTPQDIATTSTPRFNGLYLGTGAAGVSGTIQADGAGSGQVKVDDNMEVTGDLIIGQKTIVGTLLYSIITNAVTILPNVTFAVVSSDNNNIQDVITLPSSVGGQILIIKYKVTGSETAITSPATVTLSNGSMLTLISDGATWNIINFNP